MQIKSYSYVIGKYVCQDSLKESKNNFFCGMLRPASLVLAYRLPLIKP